MLRPPWLLTEILQLLTPALLLLLLCTQQCRADDSTFEFNGPAESVHVSEPPEFNFDGDQMPVVLRPVAGHQLKHSLFEPTSSMDMHFLQLQEDKNPGILQITIDHEDHDYVNLERIEPFLVEPVTCRMARYGEKTDLDLHFETREAFEMAEQNWSPRFSNTNERSILFVVEGPYCFEAAGTRSVYHSTNIRFDADRKLVVIEAEPLHAQVYWESGWTHGITMSLLEHQPEGHVIVPRESLQLTHGSHELVKRENHWHKNFHHNGIDLMYNNSMHHDLGERHEFIGEKPFWYNGPHMNIACIGCHVTGTFRAGVNVRIDLNPFHGRENCHNKKRNPPRKRSANATAFMDKHEHIQPTIYALMEAERIEKHRQVRVEARKLRRRGISSPESPDLSCSPANPTFPVCHERHMPRALQTADPCNDWLHPTEAAKEVFTCAVKSIVSLLFKGKKCRKTLHKELKEFHGIKDYAKQFVRAHVTDLEIYYEVIDDIDIRFQLEISGTVSLTFYFDVDFLQSAIKITNGDEACKMIPDAPMFCVKPSLPVSISIGYMISTDGGSSTGPMSLSGLPSGKKDKDGKSIPIGKAMSFGGSKSSSNDKTSLDAQKVGPGAGKIELDPIKDNDKTPHGLPVPTLDLSPIGVSTSVALEAHINVTLPGFHVRMPKGKISWKPLKEKKEEQLVNTITMITEYLPARLEINSPKLTIRVSAGPRWKFHLLPLPEGGMKDKMTVAGISDPLAIGGHFQPIRIDQILSVATDDDVDKCPKNHIKYEVLIRTGMDAYVMVFAQRVLDLNWIPPLHKTNIPSETIRGLWYSWRVYIQCLNATIDMDPVNDKINAKLLEWQQPLIDAFAKIGQKISAQADKNFKHVPLDDRWRNETAMEMIDFLDFASWSDRVGPGMTWKECQIGIHSGCDEEHRFLVAEDAPPREEYQSEEDEGGDDDHKNVDGEEKKKEKDGLGHVLKCMFLGCSEKHDGEDKGGNNDEPEKDPDDEGGKEKEKKKHGALHYAKCWFVSCDDDNDDGAAEGASTADAGVGAGVESAAEAGVGAVDAGVESTAGATAADANIMLLAAEEPATQAQKEDYHGVDDDDGEGGYDRWSKLIED
ncbi:uncharacterized protein RCC_04200 [Ramularia collo-cygni]|uniref:DUF7029 domain-containing protein n=1 Tax=Ramularia collo-cygni TaxID=112498 RepID=A0A2D3V4A4_9PEZI|nr:uncharacterized protein RCC_04200 [Ramularia collo-cygni]CZT18356.1 uncharacterized protein RCC_04200 [Ramularia collo-cygni]